MAVPLATASTAAAPPSTLQQLPHACATEPAYTHEMTQPLPPLAPALGSTMATEHVATTPPLPDVSEAVHARVAQRLQGTHFCSPMRTHPVMRIPPRARERELSSWVSFVPGLGGVQ